MATTNNKSLTIPHQSISNPPDNPDNLVTSKAAWSSFSKQTARMLSETYTPIKSFVRVLPTNDLNWDHVKILNDRRTVYVKHLQDMEKGGECGKMRYRRFETDGVFYNVSQKEVFEAVTAEEVLYRVLDGHNLIIMCYGQTGTGKSTTFNALDKSYIDRGLVPRIIESLYMMKRSRKMNIQVKYLEMNRRYAVDLLKDDGEVMDMNTMRRVDPVKVDSCFDAFRLLFQAEARKTLRTIDYHSNMASSVITFVVTAKQGSTYTVGKLHVVDLCGTDTLGNPCCFHKTGPEVGTGNLVKSQLEQFVLVLEENNQLKVRSLKRLCLLVNYLKDELNKNCMLRVIGHLHVPPVDLKITYSMLRFGQSVKGLVTEPYEPEHFEDEDTKYKTLEAKFNSLVRQQIFTSMLKNEDMGLYHSQERYRYIEELAYDFLRDRSSSIVLLNAADVPLTMQVLKNTFIKADGERARLQDVAKAKEEAKLFQISETPSMGSRTSKKVSSARMSSTSTATRARSSSAAGRSKKTVDKEPQRQSIKRSGKRRGSAESAAYLKKVDVAAMSSQGMPVLPETVPGEKEAWDSFVDNPNNRYREMRDEIERLEGDMVDLVRLQEFEASQLKEFVGVLSSRKEELRKAQFLRNLDEHKGQIESPTLAAMESSCANNVKVAEWNVSRQEEKVLRLHTEMNLNIKARNNIKADIEAKYEDFCRRKYSITVPNVQMIEQLVVLTPYAQPSQRQASDEDEKSGEEITLMTCFEDLRKRLWDDYERRQRSKVVNQKWVQSCKLFTS